MTPEQQEVAEQIRSGKYFDEARAWYQVIYISPVAERSFFLIVVGFAILVAAVSIVAVLGLLPITERPGLLIASNQIDQEVPSAMRIRQGGMPMDEAMERFMVMLYVASRESYTAADYATNMAFIAAHSDAPTNASYTALYGKQNARSPANILGSNGQRRAAIQSVTLSSGEPRVATVKFSTELTGVSTPARTQWTATLGYYYSPMQTKEVKDPATGAVSIAVEDPQFQVVNYAVTQTP